LDAVRRRHLSHEASEARRPHRHEGKIVSAPGKPTRAGEPACGPRQSFGLVHRQTSPGDRISQERTPPCVGTTVRCRARRRPEELGRGHSRSWHRAGRSFRGVRRGPPGDGARRRRPGTAAQTWPRTIRSGRSTSRHRGVAPPGRRSLAFRKSSRRSGLTRSSRSQLNRRTPCGPTGARSPSHGASGLPKVAVTRSRSTDAASVRLSCTSPAISVDERPMVLAAVLYVPIRSSRDGDPTGKE